MTFLPPDRTLTTLYVALGDRYANIGLTKRHFAFYRFVQEDLCSAITGRNFRSWNTVGLLSFWMDRYGELLMARKSKSAQSQPAPANQPQPNAVQWINLSISSDDEVILNETELSYPYVTELAIETAARGGSFGVKPAPRGDGFMCFLIRPADDDNTVSIGVSAYASTPADALLCLLYKYDVLLAGALLAANITNRPVRRFG